MTNPFNPKGAPVRRLLVERYLLISLIGFAGSVLLVRLFLELTNYPRVEYGELHIAHVIWGGLILFVAALLPLMFANRWALFWSALSSGVGFGLFIDEIGKFITRTNDYFYPPAAPIIYAFFLLTVLIYLQFRRPREASTREDLYHIFSTLEELLDQDLDPEEKEFLYSRLNHIITTSTDKTLIELAKSLRFYIENHAPNETSTNPGRFIRWINHVIAQANRFFSQPRLKIALVISLLWVGILSATGLFNVTLVSFQLLDDLPDHSIRIFQELSPTIPPLWVALKIIIQGVIGICSILAAALFLMGKEKLAANISVIVLTASLTIVNFLVFYLDQFSASINAMIELIILLGLLNYRRRFVDSRPPNIARPLTNEPVGEQSQSHPAG
ncbi:MAG: hypothetical protein ROW48_12075 [Bellilinea sp.]